MLVNEDMSKLTGVRIQAVIKKTGCQPVIGIVKAVSPLGLKIKATGRLGIEIFVFWSSISHFAIEEQAKEIEHG